ncbi:hypothetical protein [Pseudonocardia sp. GCM10023141]|uniref:hypothetical protein n=1 Tax=Pseudonocardia sp. GCM10023141 TaxID=3252653 RepID=UPI003610EE3D
MASSADVLAANGILRAADVVWLAAQEGLELAAAATMLQKETGGGRNVWGSAGVSTGGVYVKGSEVTQSAYLNYKAIRAQIGNQGVGPCQLTATTYQNQADAIGGCWDPIASITIGFRALAGMIRANGLRNGFRAYNGSGPAAECYADDSAAVYNRWRGLLAGSVGGPAGPGPTTPGNRRKDEPVAPIPLQVNSNGTVRAALQVEADASSLVIAQAGRRTPHRPPRQRPLLPPGPLRRRHGDDRGPRRTGVDVSGWRPSAALVVRPR